MLLVPEQFSSSAESMVYAALGDSLGAHAEVYSFKSYAEKVLKTHGGVAVATLSDAARTVAVRRAMDSLGRRSAALPQAPPRRAVLQPVCAGH